MHPESEHGLRVQLATALRERDDWKAQAEKWVLREAASVERGIRADADALSEIQGLQEALAAARREVEGLRTALRQIANTRQDPRLGWDADQFQAFAQTLARAALASPGDGGLDANAAEVAAKRSGGDAPPVHKDSGGTGNDAFRGAPSPDVPSEPVAPAPDRCPFEEQDCLEARSRLHDAEKRIAELESALRSIRFAAKGCDDTLHLQPEWVKKVINEVLKKEE